MNYPLRSKPNKKHLWKTALPIIIFLLLSLLLFLFPNKIRQISQTIVKPIWLLSDTVARPFTGLKNYFVFKNNLIKQNMVLEDQVASLKLKEIDYDILAKENEDLKTTLGHATNSNRILSTVLSKPPRSPYDTFVVDTGLYKGIVLGSRVYFSGNVIIGQVTSVTEHTSLVTLFSSSGHKQEATLSRTGALFELLGNGGANLKLEVPKDADILWGDVFVYPGISSSVIGSVYYIDINSQSSFKTIYLRIPGNVFSAKYVFVEKTQ